MGDNQPEPGNESSSAGPAEGQSESTEPPGAESAVAGINSIFDALRAKLLLVASLAFGAQLLGVTALSDLGDLGPQIDRSAKVADLDGDLLFDCLIAEGQQFTFGDETGDEVVSIALEPAGCLSSIPPTPAVTDGDFAGLDPDRDGEPEFASCIDWARDEGGIPVKVMLSCERVEGGPFSDSFLLIDGVTTVQRIDVDGDGRADRVKVGDEPSVPIERSVAWWQGPLGSGIVALGAIGSAAAAAIAAKWAEARWKNRDAT